MSILLKEVSGSFERGGHEVNVKAQELKGNGVIYYTLVTEDFKETKKLILIE